ncbi:MAG: glycosyltransferase family 2 protein [Anaerolineae bacterium]|nr:glycosyltransferase family 2 protein [Anaerolineae bacterium]
MKNINIISSLFKKRSGLRIVMTLLIRDEADIIRDNIEFHLNHGVDFIVAMDNHSVDGTTDILREYEKAGKLQYIYEPSDDYLQDVWVTNLARQAFSRHQADWVINGDADEFFISQNGTLKDVLKTISPAIGMITVKRHDMVPMARPEAESPPVEMIYRKQFSNEWVLGNPIVDKIIHRGTPDIQIARGGHAVASKFIKQQVPCSDIITFHYPIRSVEQFTKKVRNVGSGRRKNNLTGSRYDYWYSSLLDESLGDVYLSYQLDDQQIKDKISSGDIIEDRRLAVILARLHTGNASKIKHS